MKYVAEIGSAAMIYIPRCITTGSAIQKLIGGTHRLTDSTVMAKACFHFFKIRKVG
jgi:hypothetical protein